MASEVARRFIQCFIQRLISRRCKYKDAHSFKQKVIELW